MVIVAGVSCGGARAGMYGLCVVVRAVGEVACVSAACECCGVTRVCGDVVVSLVYEKVCEVVVAE